jgi:DNA-binding SARP family transcriptional activator
LSRRALDVTGSVFTTLLVFGATPAVLLSVVGDPLAGGMGHQWSPGARLGLAVLVLVAWVAWAVCCTQLARAVVEQVRRGHAGTPAGAVLTDRVAARMAAGVLALAAFGAPLTLGAGAGASGSPRAVTVGRDAPTAAPAPRSAPAAVLAAPATSPESYVVRPGDSLWSIAAALLGDGDDWPAIAALNLGRTMGDGLQFVDPNTIHAGWTLLMPDQGPPVAPVTPDTPFGTGRAAPRPASPLPAATELESRWLPVASPAGISHSDDPSAPPFGEEALVQAQTGSLEAAGRGRLELPGLAALGVGALACAALTRRARRTRLLRQVTAEETDREFSLSPRAIDASILLARRAGLPVLDAFEAANYGLAAALTGDSGATVGVRAVCVGASGVDFWLAEAGQPAPDGLTLSPDGRVWHAAPGTFSPGRAGRPLLPVVLPVGEDDRGTWLVPLGPGSILSLLGESAPALWRAARPVQEAWSWADMVLVTEDALVASGEVQLRGEGDEPGGDTPQVLYFGDPAELTDAVARQLSIVTLTCAPSSDVTVLVDRRGASIHPLGKTVRPHLMDETTAQAVGELVEPVHPPEAGPGVRPFGASPAPGAAGPRATAPTGDHTPGARAGAAAPGLPRPSMAASYSPAHPVPDAGTVEVRLLTPKPRLEGLAAALVPNRARRAVELVAYLALHTGEEVTSERLRTRVLGSSDADAASKTLFNIAAAARRAMGLDATGAPLLPPGTRNGHYRVAEGVTTDVHRAAALALAGSSTADPDTAMGLLRTALDLVEGEPMANALSGYTWWEPEGHGARIATVLVNAARDLAALAIEAELFELAQWGLAQARLVDPYSEAISRAAMQVAAAAGDVDRLRREWGECRRRMDELDPGSAPSARTERLYGELSQLVLVGGRAADL